MTGGSLQRKERKIEVEEENKRGRRDRKRRYI